MEDFFNYAMERYLVHLRRNVLDWPAPWTNDPILQKYRFCNVFREDDQTTRWIRATLSPFVYGERLLGATVIARWFNKIETLERLLSTADTQRPMVAREKCVLYNWYLAELRRRLKGVNPLVTGAYMVKTPARMSKLDGIIWCLEQILPEAESLQQAAMESRSLEHSTKLLAQYPYLGPFMAYEIVTDLRHTPVLENATDIMTWANPGPGAVRGLGRVLYGDPDHFAYLRKRDAEELQRGMREILKCSQDYAYWPPDWPAWEMRDVEHTLCEFAKYCNALEGKSLKRRFDGLSQ